MAFLFRKFQEAVQVLAKSPTFAKEPRRLQFEADINRLFLYTSYNRLGKDAAEADAEEIIELANNASIDDQQNQVHENIHLQIQNFVTDMDHILVCDLPTSNELGESDPNNTSPSRRSGLSLAVGQITPLTGHPVAETGRGREESKEEEIEIRVCTNRTCRNQGSLETFRILSGIAPPFVSVNRCGCLGRCGSGPNVVVLPDQVFVGHCGTPFKAAQLMMSFVNKGDNGDGFVEREIRKYLDALSLRMKAEDLMDNGDFDEAQILLSQAIDLKPYTGVHISYKSRSAARLAVGNVMGALEDANEALILAPKYPEAYLCQGDALMAMDKLDAAENSYLMALQLDQSLRRSKSFKARIAKLQERRAPV